MVIDTHAHLYASEFDSDIDDVIIRARKVGLRHILLPNIDVSSISRLDRLISTDPVLFKRMMGLHPCSVNQEFEHQLSEIKTALLKKDCVAVGEIGIDLYWDKTFRSQQEKAFLQQCQWAVDYDLPIVIHSRESISLIIELIQVHFPHQLRGVFHCFSGNSEQALQICDLGFYLGIGGVITFKNANLSEQIVDVPLNRIVVETDAPYLAPVPYRGKRNESSYILEVIRVLANTYGTSEEEISNITSDNALQLFNL